MNPSHPSGNILVLGTSQDGRFPQAGCNEECCERAWNDPKLKRLVSSLAILSGGDCWLIDITPDFSNQLRLIEKRLHASPSISGIFISHAHMGHYMGLMELGLEVMNTNQIPVYVMEKMKSFLEDNSPFTQLIELDNIQLRKMEEDTTVQLNKNLSIKPFLVPHRNEFSETVGFIIMSQDKSLVYIPDIDSWDAWDRDINDLIRSNDILLVDGTFFSDEELPGRNMYDVPHPFIKESVQKFSHLDEVDRRKVYFTHFNHTNPAIKLSSFARSLLIAQSFNIAEDGMEFIL